MLRRVIVTAAIALLVIIAAGAAVSDSLSRGVLWVIILRWIIAALALLILGWLVFRSTDVKSPEGTGLPQPLPPTRDEIALAYCNVGAIYDRQALKLLINMMIDRPNYLERINENVTLEDETPELQVSTRQVFRVRAPTSALDDDSTEHDSNGRVLVPVVLVEKGTLLDGFEVRDSNGNAVPTLSYNQTRGLLAHLIENIIRMVPEQVPVYRDTGRQERIDTVKANLVTAVCAPRRMNKKDSAEQVRIKRLLD